MRWDESLRLCIFPVSGTPQHTHKQNIHYPKEKLPKIITHKWKFGNLLEASNTLPMKEKDEKKVIENDGREERIP